MILQGPGLFYVINTFYYPGIYELKKYTNKELDLNALSGIFFLSIFAIGSFAVLREKNQSGYDFDSNCPKIFKFVSRTNNHESDQFFFHFLQYF